VRVGFIGLGAMGGPMARNLVAVGFEVAVHARSPGPVEGLVAVGATDGGSPAGVADGSDVVITMLPDGPDVRSVVLGREGVVEGIQAGGLVVDMSTIDPAVARDIAGELSSRGVGFIDAPVSGGPEGAAHASLSIMVGGEPPDVDRARPLLEALGSAVAHLGPVGAGQVCKACNQLVTSTTIEVVAEALAMARAAGLDPAQVRAALQGGYAASRILEVHGRRMLERDFVPGFRSALLAKDARIVGSVARASGVEVPAFAAAAARLRTLVDHGHGDLDPAALVTLFDEDAPGGDRSLDPNAPPTRPTPR
jgi:2-hydroxy-3-oxopropionate reductase